MKRIKLLLLILAMLALNLSASAQDAMAPAVEVADQVIVNGMATVNKVVSSGPGFIVIHIDNNGSYGPVIGHRWVNPGENFNVAVPSDIPLAYGDAGRLTQSLSAMRQAAAKTKAPAVGKQLQNFVKVTKSYWPGLFRCYASADIPRTNNDLEHLFGSHRYHERRASGRKRASPGLVVRGSVRVGSGLATRRRPDLRWRARPLPELQRELLRAAGGRVRPGGAIVYSVCTINADESEAVVDRSGLEVDPSLAAEWPRFRHSRRPEFLQTLPHVHGTSGFFVARLLVP